jgi:hypothetical protein
VEVVGIATRDLVGPLVSKANFFKHADRDPDAILVLDEDDVRFMLNTGLLSFRRRDKRLAGGGESTQIVGMRPHSESYRNPGQSPAIR